MTRMILGLLLGFGCATTYGWHKPGAGQAEHRRALAFCIERSPLAGQRRCTVDPAGQLACGASLQKDPAFRACMDNQGFIPAPVTVWTVRTCPVEGRASGVSFEAGAGDRVLWFGDGRGGERVLLPPDIEWVRERCFVKLPGGERVYEPWVEERL